MGMESAPTLFSRPIATVQIFAAVLFRYLCGLPALARAHYLVTFSLLFVSVLYIIFEFIPDEQWVDYYIELAAYWVFLGILSSIGLGTGLHTFVLYLGPLVAQATLTAYECGHTNFELYGPNKFMCGASPRTGVTLWSVVRMVQLEAVLWGIGTAIGEIPPFAVARAARLGGEAQPDELTELQGEAPSIAGRAKLLMLSIVRKYGFWGILAFASVPNPLFDLAGVTCGHFLIPFSTFFSATLIGKAFIKSNVQVIGVVFAFSKNHVEDLVAAVNRIAPSIGRVLHDVLSGERAKLQADSAASGSKGWFGYAWDAFLAAMIAYFVLSIVHSTVRAEFEERQARSKEEKKVK